MSKTAAELRAELKALRASHPDHQPVSKMKKSDLSGLLEKLKHTAETVPMMGQHQEKKVPKVPKDEVIKISKQMVAEDKPKKAVKKVKELLTESDEEIPMKEKGEKKHIRDKNMVKLNLKSEMHATKKTHAKDDDAKKNAVKDRMAKVRAAKKK